MRGSCVLALLFLLSCTPIATETRPIVTAEGHQRVMVWQSVTMPATDIAEWYSNAMETIVPPLRVADGNVGVYVLRQDDGNRVTMSILSIWKSSADVERCRAQGACRDVQQEEILFESTR